MELQSWRAISLSARLSVPLDTEYFDGLVAKWWDAEFPCSLNMQREDIPGTMSFDSVIKKDRASIMMPILKCTMVD